MGTARLQPSPARLLQIRLAAVFIITLAGFGAQLVGSVVTGSIALLTDTVHLLTDLLALLLALFASVLALRAAKQKAGEARARRIEALAALAQAVLLIGVGFYAVLRGLKGIVDPHIFLGEQLLFFASLGLFANIVGVAVLYPSRKANLNLRAAFLEVLSDAVGSLLVMAAAVIVLFFGFYQADPIAAFALAALILPRGARLLLQSLRALLPPRRALLLGSIGGALVLSLAAGIGLSKLHQIYYPSQFHVYPAAVDRYLWTGEERDEAVELRLDRDTATATLSHGCVVGKAPYDPRYGGAAIGSFAPAEESCPDGTISELFTTSYVAYADGMRDLLLVDESFEEIAVLSSEERERDQDTIEAWQPFWDFVFAL